MITTSDDHRAPSIFSHHRKAPVAADVIEATDDAVFRQNQEDRICPDIVSIIGPWFLESVTMCNAMPSLQESAIDAINTVSNL
jgi:hypothetical protein